MLELQRSSQLNGETNHREVKEEAKEKAIVVEKKRERDPRPTGHCSRRPRTAWRRQLQRAMVCRRTRVQPRQRGGRGTELPAARASRRRQRTGRIDLARGRRVPGHALAGRRGGEAVARRQTPSGSRVGRAQRPPRQASAFLTATAATLVSAGLCEGWSGSGQWAGGGGERARQWADPRGMEQILLGSGRGAGSCEAPAAGHGGRRRPQPARVRAAAGGRSRFAEGAVGKARPKAGTETHIHTVKMRSNVVIFFGRRGRPPLTPWEGTFIFIYRNLLLCVDDVPPH